MRLLLVEDSRRLRESVSEGLRRSGYAVDSAADGDAGLRYLRHNSYDALILDLMLPDMDGLDVLRSARESGSDVHVLILTSRGEVEDRVAGLRHGADDYLVKPFAFDELLARIEALVRRRYQEKDVRLSVGGLVIDTAARVVERDGVPVELSRREYALLEYLAYRRGQVVTRAQVEDHLYDEGNFPMSNAVDRVVCSLRRKIETPGEEALLKTRRGVGFILGEPA